MTDQVDGPYQELQEEEQDSFVEEDEHNSYVANSPEPHARSLEDSPDDAPQVQLPEEPDVERSSSPEDNDSFMYDAPPLLSNGRDPLGDVFPSDGETWTAMRDELAATSNPSSQPQSSRSSNSQNMVVHADRAKFLSSSGSDFTEELPNLAASNADDFQEVLDMLNAKPPASNADDSVNLSSVGDVSLGDFPEPPELAAEQPLLPPLVLRSPIVLDEFSTSPQEQPRSSIDSVKSPESTTSGESGRQRRPAPLILGPTDKIPSILEGLAPTPPVFATGPGSDTNPLTPRQLSSFGPEEGDESEPEEEVHDEIWQEEAMKRQLDELERVSFFSRAEEN